MKEAMLARERREARASAVKSPEPPPPAAEPPAPRAVVEPVRRKLEPSKKEADKAPLQGTEKPRVRAPLEPPADKRKPETGTEPAAAKRVAKPAPAVPTPAPDRLKGRSQEAQGAGRAVQRAASEIAAGSFAEPPAATGGQASGSRSVRKLVAVGCSTGGPRALKAFLENIPGDFPAPIVIVQHMPPNFTKSLAQRLNTFSALEVAEAEHGMILRQGAAYIAPGGYHLTVVPVPGGQYMIELTKEEVRNGHRPSVDTLFESVLQLTSLERHAVIMTGMGSDGARMMKALYDSGVTSTFAESEETCVVYGMPRSAVELKCVRHILPLQEIAPRLVQAVK